ncbi:MAG TPA: cytochrome c-type biogenesis protein CcmH [Candidatus Binataceae bacterium]|nr:cytochrome c-type biogenesis protein CcmH [Candidatus Binataceae bacterium]
MRARRTLVLAAAFLALVLAAAGAGGLRAATRPNAEQVAQGLTCQCGCGLTVANCNMPTCSFSVPTRTHIQELIDQGKSQVEIIGFYRRKFGEKVLSSPTTEGFNLFAWITPFGALLIGVGLIIFTAHRWRRVPNSSSPEPAPPPSDAPAFDPELRRKLAEDLRKGG